MQHTKIKQVQTKYSKSTNGREINSAESIKKTLRKGGKERAISAGSSKFTGLKSF